ncbi:MAG TPA: hypothetical protein PKG48_08695 [Bacteroidales bacterium]|nr:hypothetical protein [Bacteroidales bacterium]HPS62552.1 hypothetical protein [Bacteroidales bacterium]
MYDPRNKHGTVRCVPRFINGNRAGPLIHAPTRCRAPSSVPVNAEETRFYAGNGRGVPGSEE